MANGNGSGPGFFGKLGTALRRPVERAYAESQYARWQAAALSVEADLLEQTARRVQPENDGWVPIGLGSDGVRDLTEGDRKTLLEQARRAHHGSPLIVGYRRNLIQYVMGEGAKLLAATDDDQLNGRIDEWWDEVSQVNNWDKLEDEIPTRTWRDGECFIRRFQEPPAAEPSIDVRRRLQEIGFAGNFERPEFADGMVFFRLVAPEHVQDPKDRISHGIVTADGDVQTVLGYVVAPDQVHPDIGVEVVTARQMLHVKIGVDCDVKRGRSLYEPLLRRDHQLEDWITYRLRLSLARSSLAWVKKVDGTPVQVRQVRADFERNAAGSTRDREQQMPRPGTVAHTNTAVDYEFKTPNLQAQDAQHDGRMLMLNMAAAATTPEFMFTGDSNSQNYATSLASEGPFMRQVQHWRDTFGPVFAQAWRWAAEAGAAAGAIEGLSEEAARELEPALDWPEIQVRDELEHTRSNEIRHSAGILSKETWARDDGIDWDAELQRLEQERQAAVEFTAPMERT